MMNSQEEKVFFLEKLKSNKLVLILIMATIVILLTLLHVKLYPTVFADEWIYSRSARLVPLSQSITPSYLYLLLFKSTNYCGQNFLSCARFINACFFVFALPFIYLLARSITSHRLSLFIAVISLLGPINSYTAYFMPESMYFFSFWLYVWFIFTTLKKNPFIFGNGVGFILGTMSLIKMHALFLLPGFIIFLFLLLLYQPIQIDFKKISLTIGYFICSFLITHWLISFMITGQSNLTFLGEKYYLNLHASLSFNHFFQVIENISIPLIGNLVALTLFFGVPFAMISQLGIKSAINHSNPSLHILQLFAIACLIPLLLITIFTTAQIVGWGPYEVINRIHMRYYNFIFPLFFVIASGDIFSMTKPTRSWKTRFIILLLILSGIYAITCMEKKYLISFIDCPELYGFTHNKILFYLLTALGIVSLILWKIKKTYGAYVYILFFMPTFIFISSYFVNLELRQQRLTTDAYDRAGQFTSRYLGQETSKLTIIGPELGGLYKTLFYIDNPNTSIAQLPAYVPLEFAKIPKDKLWILFIGDYPTIRKPYLKISMGDYTLIKISNRL